MSNAKFKADLSRFVAKANGNVELVIRKVALDLLRSLVMKSPVDTGRFRGNWMVQVSPSPATTTATDASGESTITAGATEIGQFTVGQTIYLLNHLPYSEALEYGHSAQAPAGMVRITAAEFTQYVEAQAAKLKSA